MNSQNLTHQKALKAANLYAYFNLLHSVIVPAFMQLHLMTFAEVSTPAHRHSTVMAKPKMSCPFHSCHQQEAFDLDTFLSEVS